MLNVFKKIFGTKNDRELKRIRPLVQACNELEADISALSDTQLRAKTDEFRDRLRQATEAERKTLDELRALRQSEGENPTPENEDRDLRKEVDEQDKQVRAIEATVLDDILPEAFAIVREASKRTTGLRHYDVQFIGGAVLHQGKIAEMKTGEGKTLVATLALYLNALTGRGCHLVTVNDYLARRDVQWMGPIFHSLGISVASIVHDESYLFDPSYVINDYRMLSLRPIERKDAYNADITYGTNHEFGFDYLRDNMKFTLEEYVQRELNFAIVDEVDNILIDEARTPLIISGPAEESTDKYYHINRVVPRLKKGIRIERKGDAPPEESGDYWVDEKARSAILTESGVSKVERLLGVGNLYDPSHIDLLHHTNQALKAHAIFKRDVDYIVKDGQVIIVDEFTGRLMPGRRWSDGLHQAVEAKEGVRIERENQTLATITIQNYFRMYRKLAGMTGTADTESVEFKNIYKLDVVVIPPNRPMTRADAPDVVYKSEREKFNAVVDEVADAHERGQPVLVGTVSVEKSEQLAKLLKRKGIRHNVLNAVNHEAEASVIAQAGRHAAVTIATNMAGRGTDILLGGNPEFLARADMENEWMKRSAKLPKGEQRFEESLQKLRDRQEETIQKAHAEYEPKWRPFEERQAEALDKLADSHRDYLEAAFWESRRKYEKELAELAQNPGPMRARNLGETVARYNDALQEVDRIAGPFFGDEGEQRYASALARFREALASTEDGAGEVASARSEFERTRSDYERAVRRGLSSPDGQGIDFEQARRVYEDTEREFKEAEAAYLEHRKPFEEASLQAREDYERDRREYAKAIEDVREEMDKAPHEFSERYEEILGQYKGVCEEEREKVCAAGGLYILGTERHESRRIDNQLRGRAGRQGDPGSSRFFLSLADDLLRIFGGERIQKLMERMRMEEGDAIEHRLISSSIANAQSKVEGRNFDMRKHLLEYDDVLNQQREIIYGRRRDLLNDASLRQDVIVMAENVATAMLEQFTPSETAPEDWDWNMLNESLMRTFNIRLQVSDDDKADATTEQLTQAVVEQVHAAYAAREQAFTAPVVRQLEKMMMLQTLDALWKDHLLSMDHLKEGINLRGYGQKNPLAEYKKEGFELFEEMMTTLESDVVEKVFTVQIARQEDLQRIQAQRRPQPAQMVMSGGGSAPAPAQKATVKRDADKTGRNDPCPCGSGKKYKKCHGT